LLLTSKRLVLVLPDTIDGSAVNPHPLWGDLEAAFGHLDPLSLNTGSPQESILWKDQFILPAFEELATRLLGRPQPFLKIDLLAKRLGHRTEETFTSLETLLYYPYQWVFRHQVKLTKSAILSVVPDNRLMGNLAHRFFEILLRQEGIQEWSKTQVEQWVDDESYRLFLREGAVLLMYGREPERQSFLSRVKFAAWSLINLIKQGGWRIAHTEKALEGTLMGITIAGRADLVLEREGEVAVVDLKWSGFNRRKELIRNEEDLQLVLYYGKRENGGPQCPGLSRRYCRKSGC
jgi:RecB family exonuclease